MSNLPIPSRTFRLISNKFEGRQATMPDNQEFAYAICPYDKNHEILVYRMPAHIIKCRKNYKGPPLETCMFNATHLVLEGTMEEHLKTCKDGHIFNHQNYLKQYPHP